MRKLRVNSIVLALISALLLSFSWLFPAGGIASCSVFINFIALVPLLLIQQKEGRFMPYVLVTFVLFNIISVGWITKSAFIGAVAATLVYTTLFGGVMWIYHMVWKRAKRALAYTLLVSMWIAAERLYTNGEISYPWLNIGNSFAQNPYIIQWIEYTGVNGIALWVLVVNIIIFESINRPLQRRKYLLSALIAIALPVITSLTMLRTYKESGKSVEVSVIQPNIDPYNEKFGGLSQEQQLDILYNLVKEAPTTSRYIVAPETAIDNGLWINNLRFNKTIKGFRDILKEEKPNTTIITGASTFMAYYLAEGAKAPTTTARKRGKMYYDIYNSAIQIDSSDRTPLYHKSKLVIGVEMLPYHESLSAISALSVSLGGISGMLGTQEKPTIFNNSTDSLKAGVAICYEAIYGEHYAAIASKGAQVMFVITNDGWWGDTKGYHQCLAFSRLRAIECRRSICRSANTGISAFIDERGLLVKELGWDKRGVITHNTSLNDRVTFFMVYGDIIGRVATYTMMLCILFFIAYITRKRDHLV